MFVLAPDAAIVSQLASMHFPTMTETLMATLGTEPQVVTIAMDLLAARGHQVTEVVVVHTDAAREPSLTSLTRLRAEMERLQAKDGQLTYREAEIRNEGQPLADIDDEAGAQATFRTIFAEALRVKRSDSVLHLCIAGGRKTMAVYGMAAAQLLFDEHDHLWHVVSFGKLLKEKRMHSEPGDQVSLVHIPVTRWSDVPPVLTEVGRLPDPQLAIEAIERRQAAEHRRRLSKFVEQVLTEAERAVVSLAVQGDSTYAQIAAELGRSARTVDSQLQAIYRKLETHFELDSATRVTLVSILGEYWR